MKKSKMIQLVLVTGLLSACNQQRPAAGPRVFLRSDSTTPYSRSYHHYGGFIAFRPFGRFFGGSYHRSGFYSSGISSKANNASVTRGGFGRSGYSVSTSRS